jgi:hypothetical protein
MGRSLPSLAKFGVGVEGAALSFFSTFVVPSATRKKGGAECELRAADFIPEEWVIS